MGTEARVRCVRCQNVVGQSNLCFHCILNSPEVVPEIPGYELTGILGQGGMGLVLRGHDIENDREVAIKLITDGSADSELRERFKREARIHSALDHPNIVRVFDWVRCESESYLVMELVEGSTLSDKRPLPLDEVMAIGVQLCEALIYAHEREVIHRDIKPSNVLLTDDGSVKLADFGIARPIGSASGDTLTSTNAVVGTPFFTAPEAILGSGPSPQLDVYSMGILLYNAVTGSYPVGNFEALPEPLNTIVRRATAQRPERRYDTIAELRDDLVKARSGAELAPSRSQAMTAVDRPISSSKTQEVSETKRWPLFAALALAPIAALALWQWGGAEDSEPAAQAVSAISGEAPTSIAMPAADAEPIPELVVIDAGVPDATIPPDAPLRSRTRPTRKAEVEPGTLVIHARPWAEVKIDGKSMRRAEPPAGGSYRLPAGRHQIQLRNPLTGETQSQEVLIKADTKKVLRVDLR